MCHNPEEEKKTKVKRKSEVLAGSSDEDDNEDDNEAIHIKHKTGISKVKIKECIFCSYIAMNGADLKKHIEEKHVDNEVNKLRKFKNFECKVCGDSFDSKSDFVRHNRTGHKKDKDWKCEECDYSTNNLTVYKKHQASKHDRAEFDIRYSVDYLNNLPPGVNEADLTCVCTWCPFKSNQYKVVRKHIDIHHEAKNHFPCKECYFVAQCMEDYAKHYNDFHKADNYPHACTDCSFK